jgi:hypothetical protein
MSDQFSIAKAICLSYTPSGFLSIQGPQGSPALKTEEAVRAYFEDLMKRVPHIFKKCKDPKHTTSYAAVVHTPKQCDICIIQFNSLLSLVALNWHRVIDDNPKLAKDLLVYGRKYLRKYLQYFKELPQSYVDKDPLILKFNKILSHYDFQIASKSGIKPPVDPTDLDDDDDPTRAKGRTSFRGYVLNLSWLKKLPLKELTCLLKEIIDNPMRFAIRLFHISDLDESYRKQKTRTKHILPLVLSLWEMLISRSECSFTETLHCIVKCPHLDHDCNSCDKECDLIVHLTVLRNFIEYLKTDLPRAMIKDIRFERFMRSLGPKWKNLKEGRRYQDGDDFTPLEEQRVYIQEIDYDLERLGQKAADTLESFYNKVMRILLERVVPLGHAYYCKNRECRHSDAILKENFAPPVFAEDDDWAAPPPPPPQYFIKCPECEEMTCMKCKTCHKQDEPCDFSAREEDLDPETREMLRKITPCPNCGGRHEKSHGCDHMRCVSCSTEYCYGCGERWKNYGHLFTPIIFFKENRRIRPYMCLPTFWRLLFLRLGFFRDSIVDGFEEIDWTQTIMDQLQRSHDFLQQIENVLPYVIENRDFIDPEKSKLTLRIVACNIGSENLSVPSKELFTFVNKVAEEPAKYRLRDDSIFTPHFYDRLVNYFQSLSEFIQVLSNTSDEDLYTQLLDGESILPRLKDLEDINHRLHTENMFTLDSLLTSEIVEV